VLAFAGDEGFCVKTQSELKDLEILERARHLSDEHRHTPATYASKGGGKGESSNHGAPRFNDRPWLYELCTFEFPGKRNNQRNNSKGGWQAPSQEKGNQKGGGKRPHNGHEPEAKKPR